MTRVEGEVDAKEGRWTCGLMDFTFGMRKALYPILRCFKENSILKASGPGARNLNLYNFSALFSNIGNSRVHVPLFHLRAAASSTVPRLAQDITPPNFHCLIHYHNQRLCGAISRLAPSFASCPISRNTVFEQHSPGSF